MTRSTALLLMALSALTIGTAELNSQASGAATTAPITMEPVRQLRKGVDAWPLIVNPSTPAATRVNATLTRLNKLMQQSLRECDEGARDAIGNEAGDWERSIKVTMTGPRFLSLVARDGTYCGGAHPSSDTLAMVFDLNTGIPVNWMTLIAKSANASWYSGPITDGTNVGAPAIPALRAMSVVAATDCKDIFQDSQSYPQLSYQLWPDAASGKLIAEPFGLPQVAAPCAEHLELTIEQARKIGFDETLLTAIEQAHKDFMSAAHHSRK
jgi:hypothetical protein